jgi:hypothetical protein
MQKEEQCLKVPADYPFEFKRFQFSEQCFAIMVNRFQGQSLKDVDIEEYFRFAQKLVLQRAHIHLRPQEKQ